MNRGILASNLGCCCRETLTKNPEIFSMGIKMVRPDRVLHGSNISRIEYKILLVTFKIICGCSPSYQYTSISFSNCGYQLRSTSSSLLQQPRSRMKHYGDRAFSYAAPRLWNSLPENIRKSASIYIFKKYIPI